jgi:hypothetical protein
MGKAFFSIRVAVALSLSLASTILFAEDETQSPRTELILVTLAPLV